MEEFFAKIGKIRFNKGSYIPKLGDKFGKFTLIEETVYKTEKDNHNFLKVRCECGYECIQSITHLINKNRLGCCECYVKYKSKNYKVVGKISSKYFSEIKRNAIIRNLEFNLSMTFLDNLFSLQDGKCALSGMNLNLFPIKHSESRKEITASLDRIDSSKGYVENNVQFVHKAINIMKGCLDNSEFINICKYVSEKYPEYKDNFEPSQLNGAMKRFLHNTFSRSRLEGATHSD